MRIFKRLLTTAIIFGVVFFVGGFFIPDAWVISRSLVIQAPATKIYPLLSDFKEWDKWSPWSTSKDSSLKYTYEGAETGVGAKQSWTSESMGQGWMLITAANPETGLSYDLFIDMHTSQSLLHGNISFTSAGADETNVTWTDRGDSGKSYTKRWVSFMMKPMLGKDIETALNNLKASAEKK